MRTLVLGDVHGGYKAMIQCFQRSKFDYEKDRLIVLGDVSDGWSEVAECFRELFKIKNLIYVRGNHDQWLLDFLTYGLMPSIWTSQGGRATIASLGKINLKESLKIRTFLEKTNYFFVDEKNRLYVHGGIRIDKPVEETEAEYLMWDRQLVYKILSPEQVKKIKYKEVYLGHTSVWNILDKPFCNYNKIWYLDTGGGYEGKLSIMDVDSKKIWQSDKVSELYPLEMHRI